MEAFKRSDRFRRTTDLKLTDYTRGCKDNSGVVEFTKALHKQVSTNKHYRTFKAKIYSKEKTKD